jgi:hypothetical protein
MASQSTLSFSSQDELDITVRPPFIAPVEIAWKGRHWSRIDHAPNRKMGSKVSRIWELGDEYIALNDPNLHSWRCQLCSGNSLISLPRNGTATAPALRHLRTKHRILLEDDGDSSGLNGSSITADDDTPSTVISSLVTKVNIDRFRHHLLRWIVRRQLPFNIVEDEDFRKLLQALSPSIEPYLMHKSTIRNWLKEEYERMLLRIKQETAAAKLRIHISFDLWSSPNGYAICAICSHFVGQSNCNRSVLLGMKRILGAHSGENIAEVILPVLQDFEITSNIGVFVADNVDTNDVAIKAILRILRPDLTIRNRRARCLGHIINLAAKAFIFGKDTTAFDNAIESVDESEPLESDKMKKAQEAWRRQGAIGKFHNIVVFIRSTSQRREAFRRCLLSDDRDIDLVVISDNSTRWNSTYRSLRRGLQLKDGLTHFCIQYRKELRLDLLSDTDWDHLEEIANSLKPFYQATKRLEGRAIKGHHGAVWEVLPTLEALLQAMEEGMQALNSCGRGNTPLAVAYQNAWEKLNKY